MSSTVRDPGRRRAAERDGARAPGGAARPSGRRRRRASASASTSSSAAWADKLVAASRRARTTSSSRSVPACGALTRPLAATGARIRAIEIDRDLAAGAAPSGRRPTLDAGRPRDFLALDDAGDACRPATAARPRRRQPALQPVVADPVPPPGAGARHRPRPRRDRDAPARGRRPRRRRPGQRRLRAAGGHARPVSPTGRACCRCRRARSGRRRRSIRRSSG